MMEFERRRIGALEPIFELFADNEEERLAAHHYVADLHDQYCKGKIGGTQWMAILVRDLAKGLRSNTWPWNAASSASRSTR
jgi:hypothetical protein